LTIEGPGPPETLRVTGVPTGLDPFIRWAWILSGDASGVRRATHRILFLRRAAGGEKSGYAKRAATIRCDLPSTCGIRGSLKPPRAHLGRAPSCTWALQGVAAAGGEDVPGVAATIVAPTAKARTARALRMVLRADDLNDPAAVALAVELEEEHALPGAEAELAVAHGDRLARRA